MKKLEKEYNAKKSQSALSDLNKFDNEIVDGKLFAKVDAMDSNLLKDMAAALRNNKNLSENDLLQEIIYINYKRNKSNNRFNMVASCILLGNPILERLLLIINTLKQ